MNVAMMTSGGLAPCLSSSVAYLVEYWAAALAAGKISSLTIRMYIDGYKGVLTGDSSVIDPAQYDKCKALHDVGGSPIGNSRVKVGVPPRGRGGRAGRRRVPPSTSGTTPVSPLRRARSSGATREIFAERRRQRLFERAEAASTADEVAAEAACARARGRYGVPHW